MVGLTTTSANIVALDSSSTSLDITGLIQYGVLGMVLILVLLGYLWAKPSVDRLIKDKEAAEAALSQQNKYTQEVLIPAALGMVNATAEMTSVAKSMLDLMGTLKERERDG